MAALRRPPFFWLLVLLSSLYVAYLVFAIVMAASHYGVVKDPGWMLRVRSDGWFVSTVAAGGPADGLVEVGDRLLALNGDERAAVIGTAQFRDVTAGETYRVDFERRGRRVSLQLPLRLARGRLLDWLDLVVGIVFFACGAGLALMRLDDAQVRLIGLLMIFVSFTALIASMSPARPFMVGWERVAYYSLVASSLATWTLPMTFHVFNRFPDWKRPELPWRIVQWILYGFTIAAMWPAAIIADLGLAVFEPATQFLAEHQRLYLTAVMTTGSAGRGGFLFQIVCLVLALVASARNYRRLESEDSRRRIRWVLAGLAVSLIPYMALTFAGRVMFWVSDATNRLWAPIAFLGLILIPASIVMAVWKEQLFDIRVLVRRGLQYLFARTALRTLIALPIVLLAFSIFSHPDRTIGQIVTQGAGWINIGLIAAMAVALQSRQRLQSSLDRRFFREAYEQEQVLANLIDEVRQRDSLADIAKLVSTRIDSVLHPGELHIFYRAEERSERFDHHSSSHASIAGLPASFDGRIEDMERQWLERSAGHLAVPITGTGERLVGLLLLGERKSDEPYSTTDKRLLQGIASQIGLVYENQHLKDRVRRDADVRRDVLARLEGGSVSLLKECPACGRCYDGGAERCEQEGAELTLTLPIERTLDGKYRLDRAVGRGGFGAVFEAWDLRLQRPVAAKVMMGSLFGDQTALRRFEREARAAAKIDHPNITRVHDYGTVGSGGAFLIMELVAGRTWRAELHRTGTVAPSRAAEWFRQLLAGLQFAHGMGVVHRDLKPENVMVVQAPDGEVLKIMDFGLAKVREADTGATESVTLAGTAMGTIGYMAPETLGGGLVDERADLFGIGVMVVETLVGVRPFTGQTPEQVLASLLRGEYHLPGESPELRALDAIVQRCLAKDPRDRYGSASELAGELVPALARCEGLPPATGPSSAADGSLLTRSSDQRPS